MFTKDAPIIKQHRKVENKVKSYSKQMLTKKKSYSRIRISDKITV